MPQKSSFNPIESRDCFKFLSVFMTLQGIKLRRVSW